jgi:hypothetical protein
LAYIVNSANNLIIQLSDQTKACQDNIKFKQLSTRTSKLSGAFNWAFTLIYGIGFDYIKIYVSSWVPSWLLPAANQKLSTAASEIFSSIYNFATDFYNSNSKIDCFRLGYNIGIIVSNSLEAKVDSTVALVEVSKLT